MKYPGDCCTLPSKAEIRDFKHLNKKVVVDASKVSTGSRMKASELIVEQGGRQRRLRIPYRLVRL